MEAQTLNNPPAGPDSWYWRRGEAVEGPLSEDELRALARSGALLPTDRVWHAEFPAWARAGAVPGLYPPADKRPLAVVSDALPLLILAALVACFLVYFAHATPLALEARALRPTPETPGEPFAVEAQGEDTYAIEICNHTSEARLYAAVGYFDPLRRDWVTRGWFAEDRGACQVAIKNLREPVYVYAETKDGASRWADDAGREFCLEDHNAFAVAQDDCQSVPGAKLRKQKFKRLKLNGRGGTHTWDLTE